MYPLKTDRFNMLALDILEHTSVVLKDAGHDKHHVLLDCCGRVLDLLAEHGSSPLAEFIGEMDVGLGDLVDRYDSLAARVFIDHLSDRIDEYRELIN